MREILNFFIRNAKWFVFAIYAVASVLLLVNSNPSHHNLYLTSANTVSSNVYGWFDNVNGYLNLRSNNDDLNRRNAELQSEVASLKAQLLTLQEKLALDSLDVPGPLKPYDFIVAHVLKNSVMDTYNYITINRGADAGIKPEMGVIDQNGVVGVVNVVGPNSSRIISLLNPHFRLSCKIQGNESFGSLVWDTEDPRYAVLEELPRHTVFHNGDTVVTSGYSAVFPPGIPVGIVESDINSVSENLFSLKVKLLTDFSTLDNVQVVVNYMADELKSLEDGDKKDDNSKK